MSKLSKVKLPNAIVLEEQEMKQVLGGSSSNSCACKCWDKNTGRPVIGSYWSYYPNEQSCKDYCINRLGSSYGGQTC